MLWPSRAGAGIITHMLNRLLPLVMAVVMLAACSGPLSNIGGGHDIFEIDEPGNSAACAGETRFAVIGDYGDAGVAEAGVATLVKGWEPDFVATVGDNNYPSGAAATIDENIGQYYSAYIAPYQGAYGPGAEANRFFPALGNHDWYTSHARPYLDYFTLPGNERYYDLRRGPVHLFVLNSSSEEPDGRTADSEQARWLAAQMAGSNAPWKIVVLHEAPFSSGRVHGGEPELQWDFAAMGATAVLAGHEHFYERLEKDGVLYFVNGLGGRQIIYRFGDATAGSAARYNQDYGAMLITAGQTCINFSFTNRHSMLIDSHTLAAN
jgi:tartrate-resistant acid phosphatase type 5